MVSPTRRDSCTTPPATAAFAAAHAEFLAQLAELQQMADDHHQDVAPDAVRWGHVGDPDATVASLREITDRYFGRGEFA